MKNCTGYMTYWLSVFGSVRGNHKREDQLSPGLLSAEQSQEDTFNWKIVQGQLKLENGRPWRERSIR
jgi:hypothetical protein